MEPRVLYVCRFCGKQTLELDENKVLKLIASMAFSGYFENGVFVLDCKCKECMKKQQIFICSATINLE